MAAPAYDTAGQRKQAPWLAAIQLSHIIRIRAGLQEAARLGTACPVVARSSLPGTMQGGYVLLGTGGVPGAGVGALVGALVGAAVGAAPGQARVEGGVMMLPLASTFVP